MKARKRRSVRMVCLECGRRFSTRSKDPRCPGCRGVDLDIEELLPALGFTVTDTEGIRRSIRDWAAEEAAKGAA